MHAVHWLLTGLVAAVLARIVLGKRHYGIVGYVTLGSLGGVASGWLFQLIGVTEPGAGAAHVIVATAGALGMIVGIHAVLRATEQAVTLVGAALGVDLLEGRLPNLSELERRVINKFLRREAVARDPNVATEAGLSFGERAADGVATFGGSWTFLGLFATFLLTWTAYNVERTNSFDPYPFILLNLVLSCLAAVQAPIILMSQNRQAQKDRIHAHLDYEVNLKAEMEILALHEKLDMLRESQTALLDRVERGVGGHGQEKGA